MTEWCNWSGSLRFAPARIARPKNEDDVAALVRQAAEQRQTVRVVGAGHSSSPLVKTSDVLLSLEHLDRVVTRDPDKNEAVIESGMVIHKIGAELFESKLALHNTGDVDVQTLAGAIGTGTHGTGRTLPNLATVLIGGRLVMADGAIRDVSIEQEPELISVLRVSLGTIGVLTRLRLRLQPAFKLHRREYCAQIDESLDHLDELIDGNRNFDFYWYPRSDLAKLRTMNEPGSGMADVPWAKCVRDQTGWSHAILPRERELRFDEVEYALPLEAGPACFQEVRQRVKQRWRRIVGWRVLYRTIAADDAYISPMYGRETVTISLHQNVGLQFQEYFDDIEPIFRAHGGRPHWGKKHGLSASELRPLYPEWSRYQEMRRAADPDGVFLSPDLRQLLIEEDA